MSSNIIQTLIDTRVEHPIEDIDAWVERLTALGATVEHTRAVEPSLLTANEAEVLVRYHGTHQTRQEIADAMDLSPNRIDNLRHAAEEDLLAAEATIELVAGLRAEIRPDPYSGD